MFLTTHEYTHLPQWAYLAGSYTTIPQPGKWGWEKPSHLVPLIAAPWPEEVKHVIAELFRGVGIENPFQQKLVEPCAVIFGGSMEDAYILDDVEWDKVIDYFEWEVASLTGEPDAHALQEQSLKKWGHLFSHYQVYEAGHCL